MKILFVLDQLPYPPRNGVTIPSYNYARGLAEEGHVVSLVLLKPTGTELEQGMLEANRHLFHNLWVTKARTKSKSRRLFDELRGQSFFHIGADYEEEVLGPLVQKMGFDAVWISDEGLLDVIGTIRPYAPPQTLFVAGLNDSITAVFRQSRRYILLKGGSVGEKLKLLIKWLRGARAGVIERRLLEPYGLIVVQSDSDRRYIHDISCGRLDPRTLVLANGVADQLFEVGFACASQELLFVGSLRGYAKVVDMLLDEVWPRVRSCFPEARFQIVGGGAPASLKEKIAKAKAVHHSEYVADLRDVYRDKAVSLSPVFKRYGLINKVVESMAAGVPVVADAGAFQAIPGFVSGVHGRVAETPREIAATVIDLLSSHGEREVISQRARELVGREFKWNDRVHMVEQRLQHWLGTARKP